MSADLDHLNDLYAETDDPWRFRTSGYEDAKFRATVAALPRPHYDHALEIGCGNGELARRVSLRCGDYTGLDAIERPLAAARLAVPRGRFVKAYLPCPLPSGGYDLILLSEILYFLQADDIRWLAATIDLHWPAADVVAVTWRGPSGNALEGEAALGHFAAATLRSQDKPKTADPGYRIDLFLPQTARDDNDV